MAGWLTLEELLYIHEAQLTAFGGAEGILDPGLLEAALARPSAVFRGHQPHRTPFARAAALMEAVIQHHGFADGNKRAAFIALGMFLALNGFELLANPEDAGATFFSAAAGTLNEKRLTVWVAKNSTPGTKQE